MKKALIACLTLLVSLPAAQANEEGGWFFFGAGIGLYRLDGGGEDAKPINSSFRAGINLNRFLDIGVEFSTSLADDEIDGFDFEIETKFAYAKLNYQLNDTIKMYVLGGVTDVELTTTLPQPVLGQSKVKNDDTGAGIGAGIEFRQDGNAAITLEYVNYFDDELDDTGNDFFVDSINLGLLWYF